jgi:hypothetical protein
MNDGTETTDCSKSTPSSSPRPVRTLLTKMYPNRSSITRTRQIHGPNTPPQSSRRHAEDAESVPRMATRHTASDLDALSHTLTRQIYEQSFSARSTIKIPQSILFISTNGPTNLRASCAAYRAPARGPGHYETMLTKQYSHRAWPAAFVQPSSRRDTVTVWQLGSLALAVSYPSDAAGFCGFRSMQLALSLATNGIRV